MQKILATVAVIAAIIAAVWLSVFVFIGLAVVGTGAFVFLNVRRYLLEKGILNPTPGIAPDSPEENITVIDGDFERISDETTKNS